MSDEAPALYSASAAFPDWVPEAARNYLFHTELGLSIRALARSEQCHASTVMRQVRKFEAGRDDPLIDSGLRRLAETFLRPVGRAAGLRDLAIGDDSSQTEALDRECLRVLRRLCETGAVLAVSTEMARSVVVRNGPDGAAMRTAVADAPLSEALALRGWIEPATAPDAKVRRYLVTGHGRTALNTLLARQENRAANRDAPPDADDDNRRRYALAESPLAGLARRKDKDGQPFLEEKLVRAGERLREDFELSDFGGTSPRDWDRLVLETDPDTAARDPRARVAAALSDLGPGLGDVALRCCCYLEGMEETERRMGWSARSGKIVLRIALQRLRRHYDDTYGKHGPLIG